MCPPQGYCASVPTCSTRSIMSGTPASCGLWWRCRRVTPEPVVDDPGGPVGKLTHEAEVIAGHVYHAVRPRPGCAPVVRLGPLGNRLGRSHQQDRRGGLFHLPRET